MIEIKYDNSKENLLRIQERIQKRKLRSKIKDRADSIKKLYNITDYDINNIIDVIDNYCIHCFIDFDDIEKENYRSNLSYDDLNTLYNMLEAFEKDLDEMRNKEMEEK